MIARLMLLAASAAMGVEAPTTPVAAPDLRGLHAAIANGDAEAARAFAAPDAAISIYSYGRPVPAGIADLVARLRTCSLVQPWSDRTFRLRYEWGSIYLCRGGQAPVEYFLELNIESGRITGALLYANAVAMPAPRVN